MSAKPSAQSANSGSSRRVGLARALSKLGYCSRAQAALSVRDGKVTVNGTVTRDPEFPVWMEKDRLNVQGQTISDVAKIYLVLNKPRGIVTTASDEKGRETVYGLLPPDHPWIAPVGRLDKASEGLLLLTNDSEWGARITDPGSHLDKTYHVQIAARPDEALLEALRSGVKDKQDLLRAKRVTTLRAGKKNCWLEIVLDEGRNRQIRRMLQALKVEVLRLVRVSIGPLALGELAKGQYRNLTEQEKRALDRVIPLHPSR